MHTLWQVMMLCVMDLHAECGWKRRSVIHSIYESGLSSGSVGCTHFLLHFLTLISFPFCPPPPLQCRDWPEIAGDHETDGLFEDRRAGETRCSYRSETKNEDADVMWLLLCVSVSWRFLANAVCATKPQRSIFFQNNKKKKFLKIAPGTQAWIKLSFWPLFPPKIYILLTGLVSCTTEKVGK